MPILARNGFEFHHAQKNYVMMTRWLPKKRPNTLPRLVEMIRVKKKELLQIRPH